MFFKNQLSRIVNPFLICCLLGLSFSARTWAPYFLKEAQAGFFSNDLEAFEDVLILVSKNYIYAPDYEKLFSSAIQNMSKIVNPSDASIKFSSGHQIQIQDKKTTHTFSLGPNMDENFQTFKRIFHLLTENSRSSRSKKNLEAAGIIGLMDALDPYSQYLDKEAFERSMRDTEGQYGGLGMIITLKDYKLTVIKIMKGSPASRVGIQTNDIIVNVNGKQIKGMQIDELAAMLRGPPKTKVTLTVFRPATGKHRVHTLTREIISVETVNYRKIGDHTGYIKISSFSKQTNEQSDDHRNSAK